MPHLEDLLVEFYTWRGCVVKRNQKVGRRTKGGWEMEIDVVIYDPVSRKVLHLEPSLDAHSWATRGRRFAKKFAAGRKYIPTEIFPWIDRETGITQVAILPQAGPMRRELAGCPVLVVDEVVAYIRAEIGKVGVGARSAIPEQFPLLRTIQFVVSGYSRIVEDKTEANQALQTTPVTRSEI